MQTFLNDKKLYIVLLVLLSVISLFFIIKSINEIKTNRYIGVKTISSRNLNVSGKGKVTAIPDIANLTVSIKKEADTAEKAQNLLNSSVTKTLNYLKKTIDTKDIKSEFGGITPRYSYKNRVVCTSYPCPPVGNPKIIGYQATQTIKVKVRKVDNANKIRTDLSGLGITNITGPTFSIDDQVVYKNQAKALAIKDAKANATILAKELGIKLGKIINFSENSNNYPRVFMAADKAMSSSTPESVPKLPKGETTITSNVTITYQIK